MSTGLPASRFGDIDFHNFAVYLTGDSSYIYKSTDLGTTWTQVEFRSPNQLYTGYYYSTSFFNETFVTVGSSGLINSCTTGSLPIVHTYYIKKGILTDLWAESETNRVIAVGLGAMYSQNGGNTWNISAVGSNHSLTAIDMVTTTFGFAVGWSGGFLKTTDGGETWNPVNPPNLSAHYMDVDFTDSLTGWVICNFSGAPNFRQFRNCSNLFWSFVILRSNL